MIKLSNFNLSIQLLILIFLMFFFSSKLCGPDNLLYYEFLTKEQDWGSFNFFMGLFTLITNLFNFETALIIHKFILLLFIFVTWLLTKNSNVTALFIIITIHHISFTRSDFSFLLLTIFFLAEISTQLSFRGKIFLQLFLALLAITSHFVSYLVLLLYFLLKIAISLLSRYDLLSKKIVIAPLFTTLIILIITFYQSTLIFLTEFQLFERLAGYIEGGKAKRISESIAAPPYLIFVTYFGNMLLLIFYSIKVKNIKEKNRLLIFLFFYFFIFILIFIDYGSFSRLSPVLFISTICIYYIICRNIDSYFLNVYIFLFFSSRAIWLLSKPYMMNCFTDSIYNDSGFLK